MPPARPVLHTRASLCGDLTRLGLRAGDAVMVHAAMSRVGRLLNGPDALIGALRDAVGPAGTILAYVDWDGAYDDLLEADGRVPAEWRDHVPPFDPAASRAIRDHGVLAEFIRTTPGALRSGNPGASVAAVGAQAQAFTADHPLDYGYGEGSPFARLVAAGGKVLMVAAPYDTMTLLHHAEHLARIPGKRVRRCEVPFAGPDGTRWRMIEEFDTSRPVVAGLADDYFADVVRAFLATGRGAQGLVGEAPSLLVDAAAICAFATDWLEHRAGVRIRPANADDRSALGPLKLRSSLAWGDHGEQLLALPEAATAPAEHLPSMFVAELGGRLAGFATLLRRDDGDAELEDLFVEPGLWRRGIASRLVAEAERRARALGAARLHVIGSARAQPFYEARGFEVVGQARTLFALAPVMRKALAPAAGT